MVMAFSAAIKTLPALNWEQIFAANCLVQNSIGPAGICVSGSLGVEFQCLTGALMRTAFRSIAIIFVSSVLFGMAVAQSPDSAPNPAEGQQPASPQIQSEQISPEAEAALQQKVVHAIVMLANYGVFDSIGYRLQGRTVTLTGQVLRSSLKPDAERAVKKVEGIDKVINNIEVLPPGQLDMSIREQVRQAIYTYGPLFKYANMPNPPIRIIVKNARVTLLGIVDTEADKNLCTMRANQIHDVLNVTNDLRVVKP